MRKLKDLKGKALWEQVMIARKRKTMVLCRKCHNELHAGRLSEKTRKKTGRANMSEGTGKAWYCESGTPRLEGCDVKSLK